MNHQADGRRPQVENCWLRVICTVSHGRLILRLNLQSVTGEKIFLIICFLQIKHVMMLIVFSPATWRCLQILTSVKPFSSFIRKKSMTEWISPTLTTVRIILADREFFSWMVNYVHSFWRIYVSGCSFEQCLVSWPANWDIGSKICVNMSAPSVPLSNSPHPTRLLILRPRTVGEKMRHRGRGLATCPHMLRLRIQ